MFAASVISTMNVLCPRLSSSLAPTRVKMRSAMPTVAAFAGTKLPTCASSVMQRDLPDERALARHVRPGDEPERAVVRAERRVVRDERARRQHLVEDRVPAVPDVEDRLVDQHRPDVVARRGQFRERREEVERRQHVGRVQQPRRLRRHLVADLQEQFAVPAPCSCPAAVSTFSSYSFSSGVMYRSAFLSVCLRM